MKNFQKNRFGQVLIDLLIALSVFSLILTPFLSAVLNLVNSQVRYRHRFQATQIAREALEIAYNLSVNTDDWPTFYNLGDDPSQPFWPKVNGSGFFKLEPGSESIDGLFTRFLLFEQVDENTLKVNSRVTWTEKDKPQATVISTYLINFSQFNV